MSVRERKILRLYACRTGESRRRATAGSADDWSKVPCPRHFFARVRLDSSMSLCYIRAVFSLVTISGRHRLWKVTLRVGKESTVCRPSISWFDLAERRFVIRRRVRLCRGVRSAEEFARGCIHRPPRNQTQLCAKLHVSGSPTGSRLLPTSRVSGTTCRNTPSC